MRKLTQRRLWILSLALPGGLLLLAALISRPEPASLLVPILGPWAGLAYGHSDCTFGNQCPLLSTGLVVAGLTVQLAFGFASFANNSIPGARATWALAVLSGAWAAAWAATAIMSLLNAAI